MSRSFLVFASGGGVNPLVGDLGLCLVVAGLLSVVFVRLRIPAIAALLGAGVVLGLEVNLKGLLASGRVLIVTGLVQVPLTLAVGFGCFLAIGLTGWALVQGLYPALYLGVACAFSSTLLVVKYL